MLFRHPYLLRAIGVHRAFTAVHLERLEYWWRLAVGPSRLGQAGLPALREENPGIVHSRFFDRVYGEVQAHNLPTKLVVNQVGASAPAIKKLGDLTSSCPGLAHLEKPAAFRSPGQGAVSQETGEPFGYFIHYTQFAVVIGLLPVLLAVAGIDKESYPSEPCLANTHAIAHRNGKAITMGFGLELGFIGFGELPARYQLCAVPFADVVMGLGAQREIGGQVTLEGEALGEQAAQGAAGAQRKGQQGQVQGAPDHA